MLVIICFVSAFIGAFVGWLAFKVSIANLKRRIDTLSESVVYETVCQTICKSVRDRFNALEHKCIK